MSKRHSKDSAESAAKKAKASEFNGTAFKAMLKEPGTAMKGECVVVRQLVLKASDNKSKLYLFIMYPLLNMSVIRICAGTVSCAAVPLWDGEFLTFISPYFYTQDWRGSYPSLGSCQARTCTM